MCCLLNLYSVRASSPDFSWNWLAGTKLSRVPARWHIEQLQAMTGAVRSSSTSKRTFPQ
jgi:hypothetical protein